MKAIRIHGPKDVRLDDVDDPGEPGPFEVRVAPVWCGLCGSDLKGYLGNGIGAEGPLRVMGHEFSAVIEAVGQGVDPGRVGERVCIMPLEHCGHCVDCHRGDFNLCANRSFLGLYGESALGGGLADHVVVKDYQAIPLDGLSDEQGALVEPAAVALNAIIEAGVGPGHTVLVVGAGAIGSLVVLAAQAGRRRGRHRQRAERMPARPSSRASGPCCCPQGPSRSRSQRCRRSPGCRAASTSRVRLRRQGGRARALHRRRSRPAGRSASWPGARAPRRVISASSAAAPGIRHRLARVHAGGVGPRRSPSSGPAASRSSAP